MRLRFLPAWVAAVLLIALSPGCPAQTLARPGWAGSAMTVDPWWRNAVFYRIAPEHFQDSDGDGVGDLRGIAARLDYLQALGVDAVVLQLPFDEDGFDDLLAEASRRHVRLVVELDGNAGAAVAGSGDLPSQRLQGQARHWLARGAGGILLPGKAGTPAEDEELRQGVRRVAAQFPGERVVIARTGTVPARIVPGSPAHAALSLRASTRELRVDSPQLGLQSLLKGVGGAGGLDASGVAAALHQPDAHEGAPLLELRSAAAGGAATSLGKSVETGAALLLTQRAAVLLDYGQELGMATPRRMPWTPTNVTATPEPPPKPPLEPEKPSTERLPPTMLDTPKGIVYGPYRPYVAPPPKPKAAAALPANGDPALPDLATLAGFSTRVPPEAGDNQSVADEVSPVRSAAVQERDPHSLLNLYRRLSALHHGNATMRSGALLVVHADADTVVWLRQAPAAARTVVPVLVAVNCGERDVTLSLQEDFERLGLRAEVFRSALPGSAAPGVVDTEHFTLPPHSVFVGELVHSR